MDRNFEVRYLRNLHTWEVSFRRSRFNTTRHKILSMGTQNCNQFERFVYIEAHECLRFGSAKQASVPQALSPRSGRQSMNHMGCRPLRGLMILLIQIPGACAPGFMLSPAPRALLSPLRG